MSSTAELGTELILASQNGRAVFFEDKLWNNRVDSKVCYYRVGLLLKTARDISLIHLIELDYQRKVYALFY